MEILVITDQEIKEEFMARFGEMGSIRFENASISELAGNPDVIFDFIIHKSRMHIEIYRGFQGVLLISGQFLSIAYLKSQVRELRDLDIYGFNSLPTLINRPLLEVSFSNEGDKEKLQSLLDPEQAIEFVEDRVGLVTPRIICMIINEAYFTVEEGTASKQDIDIAMKLGTNYPRGPFEWCEQIGISNVYQVLCRVYDDTMDPRYKICPLLKREYLASEV